MRPRPGHVSRRTCVGAFSDLALRGSGRIALDERRSARLTSRSAAHSPARRSVCLLGVQGVAAGAVSAIRLAWTNRPVIARQAQTPGTCSQPGDPKRNRRSQPASPRSRTFAGATWSAADRARRWHRLSTRQCSAAASRASSRRQLSSGIRRTSRCCQATPDRHDPRLRHRPGKLSALMRGRGNASWPAVRPRRHVRPHPEASAADLLRAHAEPIPTSAAPPPKSTSGR